ncbi:MAG: hypothetical protein WAM72_28635 [Xanthobacteraceae bacterium]
MANPRPLIELFGVLQLGHRATAVQRWCIMSNHKFKIGDTVFLEGSLNVPGGAYVIVRQLPGHNGEFEYQIKSAREPHDRVVRESQLSATP